MAKSAFKTGESVVYPSHGVGKIVRQETQTVCGQELKVYVIVFEKEKMTLRVPVSRAEATGLRPLSTPKLVESAIAVLHGRSKPGRGMWSRRAQEYENKINSGNLLAIAEVVRDLHKNVDDPDRSYSERAIYESALNRLAGEYAAVKQIKHEDATEKLVQILKLKRAKAAAANSNKSVSNDNAEADEAAVA